MVTFALLASSGAFLPRLDVRGVGAVVVAAVPCGILGGIVAPPVMVWLSAQVWGRLALPGPALQSATADLCWLLSRGYPQVAAVKLVGDRFALKQRQRLAVARSSCSDEQRSMRLSKQLDASSLRHRAVVIDGFNLLTTIEAALAGGYIIV